MVECIYRCDICRKAIDEDGVYKLEVRLEPPGQHGRGGLLIDTTKELCQECMERFWDIWKAWKENGNEINQH